jgi:hypothetical protein
MSTSIPQAQRVRTGAPTGIVMSGVLDHHGKVIFLSEEQCLLNILNAASIHIFGRNTALLALLGYRRDEIRA